MFQDKVEKERKTLELLQNPDVSIITVNTCFDKPHQLPETSFSQVFLTISYPVLHLNLAITPPFSGK